MKDNISIIMITKELDNAFYRHVKNIAKHLRQIDIDEIKDVTESNPVDIIMDGYDTAKYKWIVIKRECGINVPIMIFGVEEIDKSTGIPWMVATNNIYKERKFFTRHYKKYIDIIKDKYSKLFNYVSTRNILSLCWLRKCGFIIDDPAPIGPHGAMFHRFHYERKD